MKSLCALILLSLFAFANLGTAQIEPQRDHTASRFAAIEIWIDTHDRPLAAYQFEFKPTAGHVRIVGIEGSTPGNVYAEPPYYDPAAMMQERVILADFSTAKASDLPRGTFRLATIHVQITGETQPEYIIEPVVTANPAGEDIAAEFSIKTGHES